MTMGLVMLMVMLYGRFLPSVGMTVILKEKKGEEVWAATPPTLYYHHLMAVLPREGRNP